MYTCASIVFFFFCFGLVEGLELGFMTTRPHTLFPRARPHNPRYV